MKPKSIPPAPENRDVTVITDLPPKKKSLILIIQPLTVPKRISNDNTASALMARVAIYHSIIPTPFIHFCRWLLYSLNYQTK